MEKRTIHFSQPIWERLTALSKAEDAPLADVLRRVLADGLGLTDEALARVQLDADAGDPLMTLQRKLILEGVERMKLRNALHTLEATHAGDMDAACQTIAALQEAQTRGMAHVIPAITALDAALDQARQDVSALDAAQDEDHQALDQARQDIRRLTSLVERMQEAHARVYRELQVFAQGTAALLVAVIRQMSGVNNEDTRDAKTVTDRFLSDYASKKAENLGLAMFPASEQEEPS